jgi:hypothetical protein
MTPPSVNLVSQYAAAELSLADTEVVNRVNIFVSLKRHTGFTTNPIFVSLLSLLRHQAAESITEHALDIGSGKGHHHAKPKRTKGRT